MSKQFNFKCNGNQYIVAVTITDDEAEIVLTKKPDVWVCSLTEQLHGRTVREAIRRDFSVSADDAKTPFSAMLLMLGASEI